MQRFDCLDKDTKLTGKIFLEASAGTGKTFAIEHVVCRLILNGLPVSKILITTFTRASTRDLRMRIYNTLSANLQLLLREDELPFDYLRALPDKWEAILLIKNALSLIDEMQIFTICSFCYRMLSEHAFEANIDLHLDDPENEYKRGQISLAALDTLRTIIDSDQISPNQLRRLMNTFQKEVSRLVKKMVSLLETDPKLPDDLQSYEELKQPFLNALESVQKDKLLDDLHMQLPNYKKTCDTKGNIHEFVLKQIDALVEKDFEGLILQTPSIFTLLDESNLKLKSKFDRNKLHYKDLIETLAPIVLQASDPARTFLHLCQMANKRVQEMQIASPNFFLETMASVIEMESFSTPIRNKYQAVIIDEFQDTDPLSWAVFHKLFFHSVELFMVVGDPKQSIYAFRGADLPTFLRAKEAFHDLFALATNFRSTESMIDVLNRLMNEDRIPGLFTFSHLNRDLTYYEIEAGNKEKKELPFPPVHFALFKGKKARSGSWPTKELEEDSLFPYIAHQIRRLKESGKQMSDIAILVKDRYVASRLMNFFQRVQISAMSQATSSIIDTPMFSLLSLLFQLTEKPRNTNLLKQLLSHPLIGWPFDELQRTIEDDAFQQIVQQMNELKSILEQDGISRFLRKLSDARFTSAPLTHIVGRDQEAMGHLTQLISLIIENEQSTPIGTLEYLQSLDVDESQEIRIKPLIEDKAVSVLTSHMSKGLEYDVVFALGTTYRTAVKRDLIRDEKGKTQLFTLENPKVKESLVAADKEKMRLLYVSFTRAKEHLFILSTIDEGSQPLKLGSGSPLEIYCARLLSTDFLEYDQLYEAIPNLTCASIEESLLAMNVSVEVLDKVPSVQEIKDEAVVLLQPPIPLDQMELSCSFLSFSSMPNPNEPKEHTRIEAGENELPYGADVGTLFHLLLEKIIEEGIYSFGDSEDMRCFVEKELFATPLFDWKDEVFSLIQSAFTTPIAPLSDNNFSLGEVHPKKMLQEMRFSYPVDEKQLMKGFVDLFFHHEGKYYILDWKLNRLPEYTESSIQHTMHSHNYNLQASIYVHGLQLHLEKLGLMPFEKYFGGSIYFFLRGGSAGIHHFFPLHFEKKLTTLQK